MEITPYGPRWQYIPDENWEMQLVDVTKLAEFDDSIDSINIIPIKFGGGGHQDSIIKPVKTSFFFPLSKNLNIKTKFILYTRSNPDGWTVKASLDSLKEAGFNSSNAVRFVIHGWQSQSDTKNMMMIRDSYLAVSDNNVIM